MNEDEKIITVFQDEVHFQVQTSITRKWATKGSEPKVMSKPGKKCVAYSGYVIPKTGQLIIDKPNWFTFETVIESLRSFIDKAPRIQGKQYCMVLDNAPWHKKAIRLIWEEKREEYKDIRDALTYINIPPYSPDLNPIEQVWRIARREKTHNRYYSSLELLTGTMDDYFENFAKPNKKLQTLCSFGCFA